MGPGGTGANGGTDSLSLEGEDLRRLGGVTVRRVRRGREWVRLEIVDVPRLGLLIGEEPAHSTAEAVEECWRVLAELRDRGVKSVPGARGRIDDGQERVGAATLEAPWSAADLIRARVRLDETAVSHLIEETAGALSEWRSVGGRGHGNLTPEAVLLSARQPSESKIMLASPAPDADQIKPEHDARALGRLLHALVTHEIVASGEPRVEWPARWGTAWRDLRDELLRPDADPDYTELARRVRSMRPKKRKRVVVPALALVIVGVLGGLLAWRSMGEAPMVFDEQIAGEWRDLCIESGDWYLRFIAEVDRAAIRDDAHLAREVLGPLRDAEAQNVALDPRDIVGLEQVGSWRRLGEEWETMFEAPPNAREAHEAWLVFDRVRTALQNWPVRNRAADLAASFTQRGWAGPPAHIKSLLGDASPGPESNVAAAVSRLPETMDRAEAVERGVEQIEAIGGRLRDSDPFLARFSADAMAWLDDPGQQSGAPGLGALRAAVADAVQLGLDLERAAGERLPEVDRQLLAQESPAYQRLGEDVLGAEVYRAWLKRIGEPVYTRLDPASDPHPAIALLEDASGVRQRLDTVMSQIDQDPDAMESDTALTSLRQRLTQSRGRAWNRRTKEDVERDTTELRSELASIGSVVEEIEFDLVTPIAVFARSLAEEHTISPTASETIDGAWRTRRDELLARFTAESDLRPLRRASDDLREDLRALDRAIPSTTPEPSATGWMTDASVLEAAAIDRREAFIGEALSVMAPAWNGERYDVEPATDERIRGVGEAARAWKESALAMCDDLRHARESILAFKGLDAASNLVAPWEQRSIFAESSVRDAATDLFSMLDRMRELAAATDREVLASAAEEATLPVAHAAWKGLSRVEPTWPTLTGEIQRENTIRRLLGGAESQVVAADLARLGHERWSTAMAHISSVNELAVLVVLASPFEVRIADLAPATRFNYELFRLDSAVKAGGGETALRDAVSGFLTGVRSVEDDLDGRASALIGRLRDATAVNRPVSTDPTRMGPGGAGWRGAASPDRSEITFTRTMGGQEHEISFAVVLPSDGSGAGDPVYLAKLEMSLGLFQAIVDRARAWDRLASEWVDFEDLARGLTDTWEGPRGWGVRAERFARSPEWLFVDPTMQGIDPLAPNIDRSLNLPPAPEHPMQYISPRAASFASELIGCRLPTAGEWAGAMARYESETGGWNLRDQTFDVQREYVAQLRRAQRGAAWPDRGIYRPDTTDALRHDARARSGDVDPDGALWFTEVEAGPGQMFKHLVGNVAEVVKADTGFAVIGGSSLSDEQETPRAAATPIESYNETLGFADVGFRPAFTAPGVIIQRPFVDEVAFLLSEPPYLLTRSRDGDP